MEEEERPFADSPTFGYITDVGWRTAPRIPIPLPPATPTRTTGLPTTPWRGTCPCTACRIWVGGGPTCGTIWGSA